MAAYNQGFGRTMASIYQHFTEALTRTLAFFESRGYVFADLREI
jgi:hypothetical protein